MSPPRSAVLARSGVVAVVLLVAAHAWPRVAAADAQLFAVRLDAGNVEARRVGGPDAIAGIGDWVLGNGTLCAAVSDPAHESVLSDRGGVLIDLGHCGRGDDQWGVLQPMLNLSRESVLPVETIEAGIEEDCAYVVASGRVQGVRFETRYALSSARPTRLDISTILEREAPGERVFVFGDVALHGHRSLTAMTLSSLRPSLSVGFAHPPVDVDDGLAMARAIVRSDLQVLIGGAALPHGIAYGWHFATALRHESDQDPLPLATLGLNGEHFSILGAYTDGLLLGGSGAVGLLELAQTLLMDLEVGERVVYERAIYVGDRADAASVTDQIYADGPRVTARIGDPGARLHVHAPDGAPITFVAPHAHGDVDFRLPPGSAGRHELRVAYADGRRLVRAFDVASARVELGNLEPPSRPVQLMLPRGETMRLVFIGLDGTPTPRFGADGIDFRVGEQRYPGSMETNHISLGGVESDPQRVVIGPGRYRVLATRGPLFDVSEATLELRSGERGTLAIAAPQRVLETPGRVAADLHVHSAVSDDSAYPVAARLRAFAAQGAEVLVATEHDRIFDYAPALVQLGLAERIASLIGVEITSTLRSTVAPYTIGHANAFPLRLEATQYRGGAPNAEARRLRDVAADVRERGPLALLQLNHPREGGVDSGNGSYFTHLGVVGEPLRPTQPLADGPQRALLEPDPRSGLRDIDFDAIELLNGPSMQRYRLIRADWFSLLLQGERRVATANSDSHAAAEVIALPRNHVDYAGPLGSALDRAAFMQAIRAGRLYGSTGPLLDVRLGVARPGETHRGAEPTLSVEVDAAAWIPVAEVRIYVDGVRVARHPISGAAQLEHPLRFERDGFVTVEVEGDPDGDPSGRYASLAPGFTPFAFTNPIFVDWNADGVWTPPGLPATMPDTLATPLSAP